MYANLTMLAYSKKQRGYSYERLGGKNAAKFKKKKKSFLFLLNV